ncbi:unnamed protein product [Nezara viridula]|uniref:Ig-like domain-containing protein n=1 Tax=Nezara viridula TaxID=85310 RepID=A0A9P0MVH4_NEZVI|nr:unnamed protein product [Nezara viridula]
MAIVSVTEENMGQVRGNMTVMDGVATYVLECLSSNKTGEVAWFKDGEVVRPSKRFVAKVNKLYVINALSSDLEGYACYISLSGRMNYTENKPTADSADGKHLSDREERMIKWKRRSRAIWPLLGIVGQFVILAIIILVCDKKKEHFDEDDEDSIPSPPEPTLDHKPSVHKEAQTDMALYRWKMIAESVHRSQQTTFV